MVGGNFSVQRLAYYLLSFAVVIAMLSVGRSFFIPIAYGVFFAFMLKPFRDKVEKIIPNRVIAILICFLTILLSIGGIFFFFAIQISEVVTSADNIVSNLTGSIEDILIYCGDYIGWSKRETTVFVEQNISAGIEQPLGLLTSGLSTSSVVFTNLALISIYTFFFLLYSTAFKRFALGQFADEAQLEGMETLREIQSVASSYLGGMITVMLVLGVLNSIGLYLIGVPYALLWGFLGAFLAVIPYIGTLIGGMLPVLYSVAIFDTMWQPFAVAILYTVVQSLEGNVITPKVVGNSVKVNALAAVVALIFGAFVWGLAGLIIAIPLLAMLRIVMEHIDPLKPVALLLSDDLYDHSIRFIGQYNQPRHRLAVFLLGKKPVTKIVRPLAPRNRKPLHQPGQSDTEVIAQAKPEQGNSDAGGQ